MLSEDKNRQLTEVGRGTPMGELLRRYWMPVAAVTELDEKPVKPVRLMGEDLVLYRDLDGDYGLVDRRCPHRGADMSYGFVERCGLRCSYHGWLYDHEGACLERPYEDGHANAERQRAMITIKAYPVEAKGGLLWAYLGPEPRPLLPDWEFFHWRNGFVQLVFAEIPCNWFQCQENSIDPVHFEWAHANWSVRLAGANGPYAPPHRRLDFDEFEYGFRYRRITETTDETHPLWTVGRVCLWPNALFTGDHAEFRVPIDDTSTLSITWSFTRVPEEAEPFVQEAIPYWYGPIRDETSGRWITSHVMNQDFVAWMGQGTIADRSREHLASSDRGIAMIRRRFFADMAAVANGEDPKAVIRDPAQNERIRLPVADRAHLEHGEPSLAPPNASSDYIFQAGQPEHVARAFEQAIRGTAPLENAG